jgi:hypothetical protein
MGHARPLSTLHIKNVNLSFCQLHKTALRSCTCLYWVYLALEKLYNPSINQSKGKCEWCANGSTDQSHLRMWHLLRTGQNIGQAPWAFDRMQMCATQVFNQSINMCWWSGMEVMVGWRWDITNTCFMKTLSFKANATVRPIFAHRQLRGHNIPHDTGKGRE